MFDYFIGAFPRFLMYFGSASALAAVFLIVYARVTPHREFALIAEGNNAAAIQLTGTFIGFAIPTAVVISHSVSIPDMLIWGAVSAIIQLVVFFILARLLFKGIADKITENCTASGTFVGGIGIGMGVLQAACMVP
jgi:putative membrane protein